MGTTLEEFLTSLPAPFELDNSLAKHGRHIPVSEVRQRVRKELAAGAAAGVLPAGTKFSVRGDHNTMNVEIMEWQGAVFSAAYMDHLLEHGADKPWSDDGRRRMTYDQGRARYENAKYTSDLNAAIWAAERIANRHNFDKSQIETDYFHVGYYLHVTADTVTAAAMRGIQMESDPKFAALQRRASVAAQCLGHKVVASVCGRRGLSCAGEWALGQLIKLAEKADGYPLTYGKRSRRWMRDTSQPRGVAFSVLVGDHAVVDRSNAAPNPEMMAYGAAVGAMRDAVATHVEPTLDLPKAPPAPPQIKRCHHNHTQDGGRMYVDPTVFCLQCGASRKMASTTWSDGHAA